MLCEVEEKKEVVAVEGNRTVTGNQQCLASMEQTPTTQKRSTKALQKKAVVRICGYHRQIAAPRESNTISYSFDTIPLYIIPHGSA